MKKVLFLATAVVVLSLSSCKKEYDCECTIGGTTTTVSSGTKMSKKTAETWCETSSYCKLK